MTVEEGTFRLYSHVDPPLAAGDYRLRGTQEMSAAGTASLPTATQDTHLRVRSPRYLLPPDQVLSTFPPAASEGAYGSRLPQVVIKRRTLPWERDLAEQPSTTPWLALVLIAEGEGVLTSNQPVADCVTPGRSLPGRADTELAAYLEVRKSVVEKVFPTRKDVPLLAHAREVDISDTEMMMGDDDGFVAVVIANRLPVAGRDESGAEVAVKYLACLVNLEGQFDLLLEEAPPPARTFAWPLVTMPTVLTTADYDHVVSDTTRVAGQRVDVNDVRPQASTARTEMTRYVAAPEPMGAVREPSGGWRMDSPAATSNVYAQMAQDFALHSVVDTIAFAEPRYRFPVLLHWSFTSAGDATFASLMANLDSGLLGTVPSDPSPTGTRQPPLEVVETGHVGLTQKTRVGDTVRSWYRGPLVAHPTADEPGGRLPLAHASDQLRTVVPDGREDLSLASAFEIGRLLALSRPSMVAALLRWRQEQFQAARADAVLSPHLDLLEQLLGPDRLVDIASLGVTLGRHMAERIVTAPGDVLGPPRRRFDPGRPLELDASAVDLVADGLALQRDVLAAGDVSAVVRLRETEVPIVDVAEVAGGAREMRRHLDDAIAAAIGDLVTATIGELGPDGRVPDRLDALIHGEQPSEEPE